MTALQKDIAIGDAMNMAFDADPTLLRIEVRVRFLKGSRARLIQQLIDRLALIDHELDRADDERRERIKQIEIEIERSSA